MNTQFCTRALSIPATSNIDFTQCRFKFCKTCYVNTFTIKTDLIIGNKGAFFLNLQLKLKNILIKFDSFDKESRGANPKYPPMKLTFKRRSATTNRPRQRVQNLRRKQNATTFDNLH